MTVFQNDEKTCCNYETYNNEISHKYVNLLLSGTLIHVALNNKMETLLK